MNRNRYPRPLQALQVQAHWLAQPIVPGDELLPAGRPGLLSIEVEPGVGSCYLLTILADRAHAVLGYRLTKSDGTTYDVPADLSSCECPDFAYRGQHRPGGCKHIVGLHNGLAALDPWAGCDVIAFAPTAAARAAELVIDLAVQPGPRCTCRSEAEHLARCEPWPGFGDDDFDPAA